MSNIYPPVPKPIDIKKIIKNFWAYRLLFIVLFGIFFVLAFLKSKTTPPTFKNSAIIAVKNPTRSTANSKDLLQGIGVADFSMEAENELARLRSFQLAERTLSKLDFTVGYYIESKLFGILPFYQQTEIYNNAPYKVIITDIHDQLINTSFFIMPIDSQRFRLTVSTEEGELYNYYDQVITGKVRDYVDQGVFEFNKEVQTKYFAFQVIHKPGVEFKQYSNYYHFFEFYHPRRLALSYSKRINVEANFSQNSLVTLTISGGNSQKILDYLNEFINTYLAERLEQINTGAKRTIDFIDSQISNVSDSLSRVESQLQNYRSNKQVTDLSYQGQQLYAQLSKLENDKSTAELRNSYYKNTLKYLTESNDISELVTPAVMGVEDPVLNNLIQQILDKNAQKISLNQSAGANSNMLVIQLEEQISKIKKSLIESIKNNMETTQITIDEIKKRIKEISYKLAELPRTERELVGIQRKYKLNDEIYTYLLEKRAEAQIASASNSANIEIIDAPTVYSGWIDFFSSKILYALALFLSLVITISFVLIKDFFDNKIRSNSDVNLENIPVLGEIPYQKAPKGVLCEVSDEESLLAESFRNVKTNLNFLNLDQDNKVFTITSSMAGEGKTFVARNLGALLSSYGFKTVILEFDLRNPQLLKSFNVSNLLGITSYFSQQATIEDIIVRDVQPGLDIIGAGPKVPNPSIIIASNAMKEFFEMLKGLYEYIIIDTAPVGLVSESFYLMQLADLRILTIRYNYSEKDAVKETLKRIISKKLDNTSVLFNGYDSNYKKKLYKYGKNYYHVYPGQKGTLLSKLTKQFINEKKLLRNKGR